MRSKFHQQTFKTTEAYEGIVKSILMGYGLNVPANVNILNAVVIGATESSAHAFVAQYLKGKEPANIITVGVNSDTFMVKDRIKQRTFTGHVIFTPELAFIREKYFSIFAEILECIGRNADSNIPVVQGIQRDFTVLFPGDEVQRLTYGAMFEDWKTEQENRGGYFFYDETRRFSRSYISSALDSRKMREHLYEDDELDTDENDTDDKCAIAAPFVLDPVKTLAAYLDRDVEIDMYQQHSARMGEEFGFLSADALSGIIASFNCNADETRRTICIHDSLAWTWFKAWVAVHPSKDCGIACDSESGSPDRVIRKVTLQELSK